MAKEFFSILNISMIYILNRVEGEEDEKENGINVIAYNNAGFGHRRLRECSN
jgi:hypothetical protein